MPIVPSRSGRIHELVARLSSARATERDRAVARLTLLGAQAISPVLASLTALLLLLSPVRSASFSISPFCRLSYYFLT